MPPGVRRAILVAVDGPVGATAKKLATAGTGLAGNRSIRSKIQLPEWDIRFQEYRLEVVRLWPESGRKLATLAAILRRLGRPIA